MNMTDKHESPSDKMYLAVFGALAVLTAISFLVSENVPSKLLTILIVMGMATLKASLVAAYFMHLKFDWSKVKVMIIPALVLSAVLVCALLPDIAFALKDAGTRTAPASTPAAGQH
jgi:cytochrome c oxidase subunit 4